MFGYLRYGKSCFLNLPGERTILQWANIAILKIVPSKNSTNIPWKSMIWTVKLPINDCWSMVKLVWLARKKPTPSRPALTYSPLKNTGLVADLIKGKPMVNKTSNQVSGELLRWGGLTSHETGCLGLAVMNFRISWYRKKRSQSTSLRPWLLVTIVSKLVYNLLAGLTTSLEVL